MDNVARFCLKCGTSLQTFIDGGRRRGRCGACGWVFYANPVPAAGIILVEDGRVLLGRRAVEPKAGKWCIPSGFEEYDESPRQTAVREAKEETSLIVELGEVVDVVYVTDDPRLRCLLIVYEVISYRGEPTPRDDVSELRFFPLGGLPADIAFSAHREILENYRLRLETRL